MQCVPDRVGVVESFPDSLFVVLISSDGTGGWIRDVGEEGPNLGSEEDGARVARLSFLVFVVSLMSGIDTLRGATTDTPRVDVNALPIFTEGNISQYREHVESCQHRRKELQATRATIYLFGEERVILQLN